MASFDVSREWVILVQPDLPKVNKAAGDLARYIGLLAGLNTGRAQKPPPVLDASKQAASEIILYCGGGKAERNGFEWRTGKDRVEINGESERGLCNGVYSFLASLGISWPAPGQEKLLHSAMINRPSPILPLANGSACEPSRFEGSNAAEAPWRRFIPVGKNTVKNILKQSEAFAAWMARQRYDAIVLPLSAFASGTTSKLKQLKQFAGEYDIALEAGGRDLSSLIPRKYFFLHRDFFRMEGGKRKKAHHFCPTNPGVIQLIGKEGGKLFRAAEGIRVFHLWPDRGAETTWCSCPSCRAFTHSEQNRISVNAAADVLDVLNPDASITYFEEPDAEGNIPLRKNLFKLEKLPEEKEFPGKVK